MARRGLKGTLTVRLDAEVAEKLKKKAEARNQTASEFVRTLIASDVGPEYETGPTALARSRRFVGALKSGPRSDPGAKAREVFEAWNPDRRG